ncbi:MAG: phosphatase PAP2 family protein [Anaerolineae bacterium]|jgi:undecaprenyl-diphosphatase|nr:phosphatase PAP2 family protein [Anaerolineae bacterium]MBT3713540.1 phosphatase PAP2 family protein [Anaerolineae bacterium]MBT4310907.1 phosphatase PAP2 family protein [Anaerolineae bacterium]MBT4457773.1 phosphatase PAP2 family protein [Anaerolineae bacterium]MBT4843395.1 phosphatase PAP2 family protein [Anaerolineae bacterium]
MTFKDILTLDADLTKKMRVAENPGKLRTIAAFFAHSGDSWLWAVALVTVWVFGNASWKEWAAVMLGALIIMAAIVLILKFAIRRKRPEGEWGDIYRNTDPHSFPSGHATRAFLLGTMGIFLGPLWMSIFLVILAPLVALGRVAMGVHYLSDIVVGALLGILGGIIGFAIYPAVYAWFVGWSGLVLW